MKYAQRLSKYKHQQKLIAAKQLLKANGFTVKVICKDESKHILDEQDLINMIKGIGVPYYMITNDTKYNKYFKFTGNQHNDSFDWAKLDNKSMEFLIGLYQYIKEVR
jgi:hypothetical protein